MALIAALWVKPPLLGWIGFAIVAVVGAVVAAAAFVLFPRSRSNTPSPEEIGRREGVIILADAACPSDQLRETVVRHLRGRNVEVHVVAPMLPDPGHYMMEDEGQERDDAERRLADTLRQLRTVGIAATGSVATDDPLQSLADELAHFPATDLVIVTSSASQWLEDDLLDRARALVPSVEQLVVAARSAVE